MKMPHKIRPRLFLAGAALLASLVPTLSALADYPGTVLGQGPAGYWRFSETTPIVSISTTATNYGTLGATRNGVYQGDLAGRGAVGVLPGSTAAHFDGAAEYILVPWHAAINTSANWSVETWFAPDTLSPAGGLLAVLSSGNFAAPRSGWLIYQSTTGFSIRFYNQNGLNVSMNINPVVPMTVGTYMHLVLTFDGTTARFYTNGVQAITGSPTGSPNFVPGVDGGFSIAGRSDGGFKVPGREDEVAYYGTLLTPSQVAAHHDAATTNAAGYASQILASSPLLYFHLDEPPLQNTANAGTLGSSRDGKFIYPVVSGSPGPSSPAFPGFDASNVGVSVSGSLNDGGAGGYVNVPALNLNTNGVTITGWIKPNGGQSALAGAVMIRTQLTAPDVGTSAGLIFDQAGGLNLSYNWDGDDATYSWASGQALTDGVWNFAALVVKPDAAILYAPGANAAPVTNIHTHAVLPFNGTTFLGSDPAKGGLNGGLDEVAIFSRALSVGEIYSQYATAVGGLQPRIFGNVQSPAGTLYAGDSLTLSVDAGGTAPLTYQWRKGGTAITGATNASLTIPSLVAGGPDVYDVVIANGVNSITSAGASVTVAAAILPVITQDIAVTNRTIYAGGAIKLSVSGVGGGIGYQWQRFGTNLSGQTAASLALNNIGATNAGPYLAILSNSVGSVTSLVANISVALPPAGSYEALVAGDGPLSWWRLDDAPSSSNLLDSEGRNDGTWNGAVTLGANGALTNNANKAATFVAANSAWGEIKTLPAPGAQGDFTFEAWVRPTDALTTESVPLSAFRPRYGFYFQKNPDGTWRGRDGYGDLDGGTSRQALIGNVTPGKWVHLAAVYSSATGHRTYINGQWDGNSYVDFCRDLNVPLRIGALDPLQAYGLQKFFTGDIDEVAVYGKALTGPQILGHYLTGLYSTNNPPVFAQQPQSQTVAIGSAVTFSTLIEGSPTITQQWYRNGSPITNAVSTNTTLTLTNVSYADAIGKTYQVVAVNGSGSTTSLVATLTVTPQPAFAFLTNNLVLHLAFEGNFLDTSGKGHNATAVGAPTIVPGRVGSGALRYSTAVDGPQGHGGNVTDANYLTLGVFTPGASDLSFSNNVSFSVAYWFKTPTNVGSGDLPIFCSALNSYQNYGLTFAPTYNSSRAGGWSWSLGDGATYAGVYGAAGSTFDGRWHHLVHTFNRGSGDGITYLDGVNVSTVGISVLDDIDSGNPFNIGQDPTGHYSEAATNYVDDLAVWRGRVLTANEAYSAYYVGNTFGRSFDAVYPITIELTKADGNQYVVWQTGTLWWADNVNGPYTTVPGATAPYYQITPGPSKKFFRVQ
jgi:hypothetical protein